LNQGTAFPRSCVFYLTNTLTQINHHFQTRKPHILTLFQARYGVFKCKQAVFAIESMLSVQVKVSHDIRNNRHDPTKNAMSTKMWHSDEVNNCNKREQLHCGFHVHSPFLIIIRVERQGSLEFHPNFLAKANIRTSPIL
jgi:hypothetical protein